MDHKRYFPIAILLCIIILLQLLLAVTGVSFFLKELTQAAYYTVVVIGLCMLIGYAGQISLGHAGFFAIGGYTSAVLTTFNFSVFSSSPFIRFLHTIGFIIQRDDLYGKELLTFSPPVAFMLAVLFSALVAIAIGIPVIRLRGHYLAMATLGFGVIIKAIIDATTVLGAHDPITSVPGFSFFFGLEVSSKIPLRIPNYYIAWGVVIIALVICINLIHSRAGRALRSIHGNEAAANSLGINTTRYKLYTFILSAVFAAVAGVFLTHYNGSIGPSEASVMKSVRYVAIVAVGGMANLWGCVMMSVILTFLSLRGVFGSFDDIVFGAILITMMLFAPGGLLNIARLKLWREKIAIRIKKYAKRNSA
ncbi:MAG: branched-chain amino acid ABC transporter permease [Spirochaetales bacterium]|nr:branched-chain amino acid ABC transporter permease [Spirochaetales bacterium]